jgi:hypothetical protein
VITGDYPHWRDLKCWALFWYTGEVTSSHSAQKFGLLRMASPFWDIMPCFIRATRFTSGYFATPERLRTTLSVYPKWRPVISIPLGSFGKTWMASDLHQTPTWSKLSILVYRILVSISSHLGFKNFCSWLGQMLKNQGWLRRGLACTICYPRPMYISRSE